MKVTLVLADAAQAVQGKLYILGGGWNITGPAPTPMALALLFGIPWSDANQRHHWQLALLDEDGQPIVIPTPMGDQAVQFQGDFEVGRPAGSRPGMDLQLPLAINIGPLPLQPDRSYVWRCTINDESMDEWQVTFMTRPSPNTS